MTDVHYVAPGPPHLEGPPPMWFTACGKYVDRYPGSPDWTTETRLVTCWACTEAYS